MMGIGDMKKLNTFWRIDRGGISGLWSKKITHRGLVGRCSPIVSLGVYCGVSLGIV